MSSPADKSAPQKPMTQLQRPTVTNRSLPQT